MAYLHSLHPATQLPLSVAPGALVATLRHFIGSCDPGTQRYREVARIVEVVSSSSDEASNVDAEFLTPAEARICFNAGVALANGVGVTLVNLNTGECLALVDDSILFQRLDEAYD